MKYKPFKDYKKYHPRWHIQGNADSDVEKYWKWVLAENNKKFADRYGTREANIPDEWAIYDTEEIMKELKEIYLDEDTTSDKYSLYQDDDTDTDDNDCLFNSCNFSNRF